MLFKFLDIVTITDGFYRTQLGEVLGTHDGLDGVRMYTIRLVMHPEIETAVEEKYLRLVLWQYSGARTYA